MEGHPGVGGLKKIEKTLRMGGEVEAKMIIEDGKL